MRAAAGIVMFVLLCIYIGWSLSHMSWQRGTIVVLFACAGVYTGQRWHKSEMAGTYRTYRNCGHSILGALRIAARYHLGKP